MKAKRDLGALALAVQETLAATGAAPHATVWIQASRHPDWFQVVAKMDCGDAVYAMAERESARLRWTEQRRADARQRYVGSLAEELRQHRMARDTRAAALAEQAAAVDEYRKT